MNYFYHLKGRRKKVYMKTNSNNLLITKVKYQQSQFKKNKYLQISISQFKLLKDYSIFIY
jgi:hypothetical protein